jgi:hypothetical protein
MNRAGQLIRRVPLVAVAIVAASISGPGSVAAGGPVDPSTLSPVPPSFYACSPDGAQTICRGTTVGTDSGPWGVYCGSDDTPVQLFSTATETNHQTRYYDADGRLTREVERYVVEQTILDPATGLTAQGSQVASVTAHLDTPGDLSTGIRSIRGVARFSMPGSGTLFIDVGRQLFTADGTTTWEAGKHPIEQFLGGDPAVMAELCAALGSPGTPAAP